MSAATRQSLAGALKKSALASVATAASAVVFAGAIASAAWARSEPGTVARAELPTEAHQTEALIRSGGPFPHAKDGTTFGNRERLLPREKRGYYREYTVRTPGARDRGARRIVCGGLRPAAPEACYYTADHYASFKRIVDAAAQ